MVSPRGFTRFAAVLAVVLLLPAMAEGQELKIGYLDMDRLRQSYQGFKDAEEAFEKVASDVREQVQNRQQEVEMLKQQYEARKTMLTAARRQQDEQNILQKEQELIQFAQTSQMQLAQQEVELTRPLQESIFNVVQALARAENFTYIFDAGSLIYVDPLRAQDLTGQVLEELQKESNNRSMRQRLADIATQIEGELIGDGSCIIEHVAPLDEAGKGSISVLINARQSRRLESTGATAVIVSREIDRAPLPIIRVASPELALATLLSTYFAGHRPAEDGVHPTARIHPAADVDEEADIGPHVSIGPHTSVGRNVRIGAGVAIGAHCRIGAGTWIFANSTLYDRVSLGEGVIIHGGTVIGSDGFGYFQGKSGARKIPQVGGVEIGDEVEIGANTTIDRATMGMTRIGRGTKIDNLVQIGHNVVIGDHVMICAQVGIAGSTVVEAGSLIGGQAGLSDHIQVGAGSRIGGQAGVTKSIPAGSTVSGYPARPHNQARRIEAAIKRLPDLLQQIQTLEARIKALESRE